MNGNVSRAGIVADLDAMAAIGLGGVTIFDAGCDVPEGSLRFGTEEWFDTVRFATHEAHQRGLEVILSNCSGWSSSGGPWIAPSNSMMFVAIIISNACKSKRKGTPRYEERSSKWKAVCGKSARTV